MIHFVVNSFRKVVEKKYPTFMSNSVHTYIYIHTYKHRILSYNCIMYKVISNYFSINSFKIYSNNVMNTKLIYSTCIAILEELGHSRAESTSVIKSKFTSLHASVADILALAGGGGVVAKWGWGPNPINLVW